MENVVTMSLERYDEMQNEINNLKLKVAELKVESDTNVFEFKEAFSNKLSLNLTDKGFEFLTKAFSPYSETYNLSIGTNRDKEIAWSAATTKE